MHKVDIDMPNIEIINAFFRPNLSPIYPKTMPPSGLKRNPILKTENARINCIVTSSDGKKRLPIIPANTAYIPKS